MVQQVRSVGRPQGLPAAPVQSRAYAAFPGRIVISPQEFARATGASRTQIYREIEQGAIKVKRHGTRIKIALEELDAWWARLA